LDPGGMHDMRALVRGLVSADLTVLLSSHLLSEVEEICDWITMIDRGRHLYEGPVAGLLASETGLVVRPAAFENLEVMAELVNATTGHRARVEDDSVLVDAGDEVPDALAAAVNRLAFEHGITLVEIHPVERRLERRYLELVQGGVA
jgi:ABC-2 type transport system ATP-binding protein